MSSNTPLLDFHESHIVPPLGRQATQSYYGVANKSLFRLCSEKEPDHERLLDLADKIVLREELRPLKFYSEALTAFGKMGAWDHGHVVLTPLADIFDLYADTHAQLSYRARAQFDRVLFEYANQKDSWLKNVFTSYGATGRCRIPAQIVRCMVDAVRVYTKEGHENPIYAPVALHILRGHMHNVYQDFAYGEANDEAQGDGMKLNHFRAFQVGILAHAMERVIELLPEGDGTRWEAQFILKECREIIAVSVLRTDDGKPQAFYYDVPFPLDTPQPWTSLPGYKLGNGNGVECWIYKFLPDDARLLMDVVNAKLHPAVKAKFNMT